MRMHVTRLLIFTALMMTLSAFTAEAQWVVTPYLGVDVAGDVETGKGGPGGSFGYAGGRIGFEFDVMRHAHFFKDAEISPVDPAAPPNCTGMAGPCSDIDTDAISFMGNIVVPLRMARPPKLRPYVLGGLGLIRAWTNEMDRQQNDFAFTAGGGVIYSLSQRFGMRGDLRYIRARVGDIKSSDVYAKDYGFWRAAIGVTFALSR